MAHVECQVANNSVAIMTKLWLLSGHVALNYRPSIVLQDTYLFVEYEERLYVVDLLSASDKVFRVDVESSKSPF